MRRRTFLHAMPALAAASSSLLAQSGNRPLRLIYSNDTTNITSCASPWRDPKDGFTDDHLRASIDEARDADAHFLQPGLGWIPWWQSKIYSPQDHYVTFLGEFGKPKPNAFARYLLAGGDLIRTLVEHCRKIGVQPWVSYRLNDGHHVRELAEALERKRPAPSMPRHYWENYEKYRIGPDPKDWTQGVFNWAIPEVRDYKFALIQELCENYDIAGLELDLLRHHCNFDLAKTPVKERREILAAFVSRVRAMLDRTARNGVRRPLCLRIPARDAAHDLQGIDPAALAAAGADMFNLSYSYFTVQDDSVRKIAAQVPGLPLYLEMTHTTMTGKAIAGSGTQPFLRTTEDQYYTTARMAMEQGGAGTSLFNFAYYRDRGRDDLGPYTEPPFQVLAGLKDRAFLEKQPAWFMHTEMRNDPALGERDLPALIEKGTPLILGVELGKIAPPGDFVLRLRSSESIADREIGVRVNGQELAAAPVTLKPRPQPYDAYLGTEAEYACFHCTAAPLRVGRNEVTIEVRKGIRVKLIYVDLCQMS